MTKQVFQLKITMVETKPIIWRRILVDSDTLLVDLHKIIQTTIGWSNAHLHIFNDGKNDYAPIELEVDNSLDSNKVNLNKIFKKVEQSILYEYDFGDSWSHEVYLEKIIETEEEMQLPTCLDGARKCPPEDCGGVWGFKDFLKIISNPKDPQYKEMKEWLGGEYDPNYFKLEEINAQLKEKNFGCLKLLD